MYICIYVLKIHFLLCMYECLHTHMCRYNYRYISVYVCMYIGTQS